MTTVLILLAIGVIIALAASLFILYIVLAASLFILYVPDLQSPY